MGRPGSCCRLWWPTWVPQPFLRVLVYLPYFLRLHFVGVSLPCQTWTLKRPSGTPRDWSAMCIPIFVMDLRIPIIRWAAYLYRWSRCC